MSIPLAFPPSTPAGTTAPSSPLPAGNSGGSSSSDSPAGGTLDAAAKFADPFEGEGSDAGAPDVGPTASTAPSGEPVDSVQRNDIHGDVTTDSDSTASGESASESGEFSPELMADAQWYGFAPEEAKSFGTATQLRAIMAAMDRRSSAFTRQQLGWNQSQQHQQGQQDQQQNGQAQPRDQNGRFAPAQQQQDQQGQQGGIQSFEKFKIDVPNPEDFDADSLKLLNGINDHYDGIVRKQQEAVAQHQQMLSAMHDQLQRVTGHFQAEETARVAQEMDSFFNGLGETYRDTFGQGDLSSMAPNSPQATNRMRLWEEMNVLRQADAQDHRPPCTLARLRQRALASLHPDTLKTSVRQELQTKIDERNGQSVQRPTGRQPAPVSEEERGRKFVENFMRKRGIPDDAPQLV